MNKKLISLFVVIVMVSVNLVFAVSANAALQASPVFATKSAGLSASKSGSMTATTSVVCKKIYVSAVRLQRKSGTSWIDVGSLPCPTTTSVNDDSFVATKSYSSYCTSGNTYRIIVTFNADGYAATATSNSASY